MKHTHIFFSLSFLLCSFIAYGMEVESNLPQKEPESYHVMIQQVVEILKQNHPPTQKEYSLRMDCPEIDGVTFKKVILSRSNGKATDKALEFIIQFDLKNGTKAQAHAFKGSKEAAIFAQYLKLANDAAGVEWQEVNDDGDLVTTFAQEVPLHIGMIYLQVPGIGEFNWVLNRIRIE